MYIAICSFIFYDSCVCLGVSCMLLYPVDGKKSPKIFWPELVTSASERHQDRWKWFLPGPRGFLNPPGHREIVKNIYLSFRNRRENIRNTSPHYSYQCLQRPYFLFLFTAYGLSAYLPLLSPTREDQYPTRKSGGDASEHMTRRFRSGVIYSQMTVLVNSSLAN